MFEALIRLLDGFERSGFAFFEDLGETPPEDQRREVFKAYRAATYNRSNASSSYHVFPAVFLLIDLHPDDFELIVQGESPTSEEIEQLENHQLIILEDDFVDLVGAIILTLYSSHPIPETFRVCISAVLNMINNELQDHTDEGVRSKTLLKFVQINFTKLTYYDPWDKEPETADAINRFNDEFQARAHEIWGDLNKATQLRHAIASCIDDVKEAFRMVADVDQSTFQSFEAFSNYKQTKKNRIGKVFSGLDLQIENYFTLASKIRMPHNRLKRSAVLYILTSFMRYRYSDILGISFRDPMYKKSEHDINDIIEKTLEYLPHLLDNETLRNKPWIILNYFHGFILTRPTGYQNKINYQRLRTHIRRKLNGISSPAERLLHNTLLIVLHAIDIFDEKEIQKTCLALRHAGKTDDLLKALLIFLPNGIMASNKNQHSITLVTFIICNMLVNIDFPYFIAACLQLSAANPDKDLLEQLSADNWDPSGSFEFLLNIFYEVFTQLAKETKLLLTADDILNTAFFKQNSDAEFFLTTDLLIHALSWCADRYEPSNQGNNFSDFFIAMIFFALDLRDENQYDQIADRFLQILPSILSSYFNQRLHLAELTQSPFFLLPAVIKEYFSSQAEKNDQRFNLFTTIAFHSYLVEQKDVRTWLHNFLKAQGDPKAFCEKYRSDGYPLKILFAYIQVDPDFMRLTNERTRAFISEITQIFNEMIQEDIILAGGTAPEDGTCSSEISDGEPATPTLSNNGFTTFGLDDDNTINNENGGGDEDDRTDAFEDMTGTDAFEDMTAAHTPDNSSIQN